MKAFDKLVEIIATLRSANGCPWDMKQTHETLKPYLIEEAYEVLDAIDSGEPGKLSEELGDLLLHIVFHARIGEEDESFDISKVITAISDKLIERHPHVFADADRDISVEQVLANWEDIKAETSKEERYHVLAGIPSGMPALLKAYRIQEKVARFGFDWGNPLEVLEKLEEEKQEVREALEGDDKARLSSELGDLLFTIVNLCRHCDVVPEIALNDTNNRFRARFQKVEEYLVEDGKKLGSVEIEELDRYWEKAKDEIG